MFDQLKSAVFGFLHGTSIEVAIKAVIAWEAKPEVVQALQALHVPPEILSHEMAVLAAVLWGVDRLHQLYSDSKNGIPNKPVA